MKTQFSRRRNNYGALILSLGGVVVAGLIVIILKVFLPNVEMVITEPLWSGGTILEAGVGNVFAGFGNSVKISEENKLLGQQISTLQNENAVLTARAQDLTKLLGGQSGADTNILGGVLASPPVSPYDTVVVSAGAHEGVLVDAVAFATGGIPIGTVKSTSAHTATIELLSTAGRSTNAWVGENRTPLTLMGVGAGAFTATLPKAAPVTVGDSVYIPGPGAVPIGSISRIDTDPSSPTVVLYIQPIVNIFSLTWVEISRSTQSAL